MLQQGRHTCHNTGTPLGVSEAKFKTILQLTLSVKGLGLFLKFSELLVLHLPGIFVFMRLLFCVCCFALDS
jgi:hypothetical protein